MTTVRVLHVLPTRDPGHGGPVAVAEALARYCESRGIESTLFPTTIGKELTRVLRFVPRPREISTLAQCVQSADVVHLHGLWAVTTSLAARIAEYLGRPYIVAPHGMLNSSALRRSRGKKALYAALVERRSLQNAASVHCLNSIERDAVQTYLGRAPTFLLPNGVDLDGLTALPPAGSLAQQHPVLRGRLVALVLARIHPVKGFDILIPALAEARRRSPELCLVIAGPDEGGYRRDVEAMIERHGLRESVLFLGKVIGRERLVAFAAASLFVLASRFESDSVALKEALAAGIPAIITEGCRGGFDVEQEGCGLVVEPTVAALASALDRLAKDAAGRGVMARRACEAVRANFGWDEIARLAADEYRRIHLSTKTALPRHFVAATNSDNHG